MAKNRRKERDGQGAEGTRKRRKVLVPEDTNAEVLPARSQVVQNEVSVETPKEQKKLTGKKKKRFEKYLENKRRKEASAALIKRLAERPVDTSFLRSTKTLGTGQQKIRRTEKPDQLQLESESGSDDTAELSENEEDFHSDINAFQQRQDDIAVSKPSESVEVGKALKSGTVTAFAKLGSKSAAKKSTQPSWRERLEESRKRRQKDDLSDESDVSESEDDVQDEDGDDFGEWNGIASELEDEDVGQSQEGEDEPDSGNEEQDPVDESEPESESEAERYIETVEDIQRRAKQFKDWAREQSGLGATASNISTLPKVLPNQLRPPAPISQQEETLPAQSFNGTDRKKAYFVRVQRPPEIQQSRLSLPIIAEELQIMEALSEHDSAIICGETGSGKTTQIPQFLYEAGYGSSDSDTPGMIGITQPRRVAAVSMASRIGDELGNDHKQRVGYQIRFDASVGPDTAIKFMTDGVLLREVSLDLLLSKYSAIIIDEAHERSVNTDVLIGFLSRVVKARREMSQERDSSVKPLKLIIMSATIRVTDFTTNPRLFAQPPPVINVDARQYPVTVHFNRRTPRVNYVEEAFKKICKIHTRLPPGGILIFLTGQDEIRQLCKKLRERFPAKSKPVTDGNDWEPQVKISAKDMDFETEDVDIGTERDIPLDENSEVEENEVDESDFEDYGEEPDELLNDPLHVLPLYSLLPVGDQLRVFQPPPEGTRLCVVATNIAETSLTIPGIKYVVDCGLVKERVYDKATGVESFQIGWISKASAAQRSGRAGRTGPGHCYRLYSSAVFERDFSQFSEPEILKFPIEGIVLQMKAMGIDKVVNFPFPTPPDREQLAQSEKLLEYLGALDKDRHITRLGESMSSFPLLPRYSKMIILGQQFNNMPYIIAIVAGLSVGSPFLTIQEVLGRQQDAIEDEENGQEPVESENVRQIHKKFDESRRTFDALEPGCDVIRLLWAIGAYEAAGATDEFCEGFFLRAKQMKDIRKLRIQITNIVNDQLSGIVAPVKFSKDLIPPSKEQIRALKQTVTAAFLDHLAIRSSLLDPEVSRARLKNILRVGYTPLIFPTSQNSTSEKREVYIHPSSALAKLAVSPDYVVYSDIRESQDGSRLRLLPLTTVSAKEIEPLAKGTPLIQYSKPLNYPPPRFFSENGVMKKEIYVVPRFGIQGRGWELPSIKQVENVIQR